jgi:hypothetical protein
MQVDGRGRAGRRMIWKRMGKGNTEMKRRQRGLEKKALRKKERRRVTARKEAERSKKEEKKK